MTDKPFCHTKGCNRRVGRHYHDYCVVCWNRPEHPEKFEPRPKPAGPLDKNLDQMLQSWETTWGALSPKHRSLFWNDPSARSLAGRGDQTLVNSLIRRHKRLTTVEAEYAKIFGPDDGKDTEAPF